MYAYYKSVFCPAAFFFPERLTEPEKYLIIGISANAEINAKPQEERSNEN